MLQDSKKRYQLVVDSLATWILRCLWEGLGRGAACIHRILAPYPMRSPYDLGQVASYEFPFI